MRRMRNNEIVTITRNTAGNLNPNSGQTFNTTVADAMRNGDYADERGTMDVFILDESGNHVTVNKKQTGLLVDDEQIPNPYI